MEAIARNLFGLFLALVCALGLQGCSAGHFRSLSPKGQNITGLWIGKSSGSLDAQSVNISLAVFQEGDDEFSGLYDRDSGSSVCRDLGCGGTLSGRASSSVFRVQLEDRSWCAFYGGFLPEIADGHYSCYYRDGRVDRGVWNVKLQHWRPSVGDGSL
ncbi:MAG TPA: hypothetical protein VMB26_10590 [Candidatus Binataceae bacterium]|nr:hypothetical protein [Candidatus Binataceae bacterium]